MILIPEYWRAVARGVDAEDEKASIFIKHSGSLGAAREAILRKVLVDHTPEPFKVQTGFVSRLLQNNDTFQLTSFWLSKQCDVLVYDPSEDCPYYAIDQLVVVPRDSTRSVIEVKSKLKKEKFDEILAIWKDTSWVPVRTFGFAYEGVNFETFLRKYLRPSIRNGRHGVPECLIVHRQNYIFIRSLCRLNSTAPNRHRAAKYQFAVNFGRGEKLQGASTAMFLEMYRRWLVNPCDSGVEPYLLSWFNNLELPNESKVSIDDQGNIKRGAIQGL